VNGKKPTAVTRNHHRSVEVTTYLASVREQFERLRKSRLEAEIYEKTKATAQWTERLTPLEERLRRLLSQMPEDVIAQGLW